MTQPIKPATHIFEAHFSADGTAVANKNISFMRDPAFAEAWARVAALNEPYWPGGTPDVRWRAHISVWAARHALQVPGDFVECGVNTGLFSSMIYALTDLSRSEKRFFLFDTFEGIPVSAVREEEQAMSRGWNERVYNFDSFKVAQAVFEPYPNARLVRGVLPGSLDQVEIDAIAFLSMDLNVASAELETAERLWPKLSPGAVVVLDDYGFHGHRPQYDGWNAFAAARNVSIATLPTGQGLILIPPR